MRFSTAVLCFLALAPNVGSAAEFILRADVATKVYNGRPVVMWGFALDSALDVEDGAVQIPGPVLTVPPGDSTLTIRLKNKLPQLNGAPTPVSIVIPGQMATMTPERAGNGRVRSFTHETAPGAVGTYTWNQLAPGTYLYMSGTHPAVQVQMGLYGALKKDFSAGNVYQNISYDKELILLYSEVDPALHDAVASDNYGPGKAVKSTINYQPRYFLVNGTLHAPTDPALPAGAEGEQVLLRLLNAGLRTVAPLLQGAHMKLVAEDGKRYRFQKEQYSVLLSAGKTTDALMNAQAGSYPLYDRRLTPGMGTLSILQVAAP